MEGSWEDQVDDVYFFALSEDAEIFPITDDKYADGLQFQEVLMSSVSNFITAVNQHQEQQLFKSCATPAEPIPQLMYLAESSGTKNDEYFEICSICIDAKSPDEMFRINNCAHIFCNECIGRHIAAKVQENISSVTCPAVDCQAKLEPEQCMDVVPEDVFERWGSALCESMVLSSQRFYCPYKDCSVLLVDDGDEVVTMSVCAGCQRLFCAQCNVAWHAGLECDVYQSLDENEKGREDLMLIELANSKNWKRCPRCKFYVERNEGCSHMTCRCKFEFCYGCGSAWNIDHQGCLEQ